MRVGILGSGLMGGKLGTIFARAGHEVVFSYVRSEQKLKVLARDAKGKARAGTPREAAQEADAVLLAVHWSRIKDVLNQTGDWIYLLNFWTRTFNRTSAPVAGIRSDCTRTTIPCNALHSTSAKNSGFCRSGPSAMTNSAKAARRAVGVCSLANLIFVGKTNIAS